MWSAKLCNYHSPPFLRFASHTSNEHTKTNKIITLLILIHDMTELSSKRSFKYWIPHHVVWKSEASTFIIWYSPSPSQVRNLYHCHRHRKIWQCHFWQRSDGINRALGKVCHILVLSEIWEYIREGIIPCVLYWQCWQYMESETRYCFTSVFYLSHFVVLWYFFSMYNDSVKSIHWLVAVWWREIAVWIKYDVRINTTVCSRCT